LLLAFAVSACGRRDRTSSNDTPRTPQIVARSGLAMGSSLTVMAWTADQDTANRAFDAVFAEFDRLDHLMSVWKDGSDIVRLNAAAGEHAVPISADTMAVLQSGRQASEWTRGKFDVTFAALSDLWKFDQDQDDTIPTPAQIAARLPLIDYRKLILDVSAGTAFLQRKGMRVNVGGVGKGYAVDKGVAILRSAGLHDFSVQAGGDLYVAGKRGDRPWRLGIADPRAPDGAVFARVELGDSAFSTAGDYERFFIKDGVRYHHILDPTTGQPSRLCRSVTIAAKNATIADAVDDGVFLLGPEAGMALIEKLPDVEGVIVGADNQVHVSSGLKGKVAIVHPPTDGL
jgi:thiamine biosynthesis lipoprotein